MASGGLGLESALKGLHSFSYDEALEALVFKRFDKHKDEEQSAGLVGCL